MEKSSSSGPIPRRASRHRPSAGTPTRANRSERRCPIRCPSTCVAFTPSGKHFVTGCRDGAVRLWDAATGKLVGERFRRMQVSIHGLDVSPDGNTLALATATGNAQERQGVGYLRDLASGKRIGSPFRHKATIQSVVFSPNGKIRAVHRRGRRPSTMGRRHRLARRPRDATSPRRPRGPVHARWPIDRDRLPGWRRPFLGRRHRERAGRRPLAE